MMASPTKSSTKAKAIKTGRMKKQNLQRRQDISEEEVKHSE